MITYYNSLTNDLNIEMLESIEKSYKIILFVAIWISKNLAFKCKENNKNGNKLNDFFINNNAIILNTGKSTFFRDRVNFHEELDLFLIANKSR